MLTVADVTDCVSNGSTVSVSPVKRLITMYNSNGVADKKSRRKAKASNKSQNTKDNLEVARKGCDELNVQHNLTNSGENSPYSGSDSSSCSTDDQIVDTSLSKPLKRGLSLSIDISRDNSTDPNEIFWEVHPSTSWISLSILDHKTFLKTIRSCQISDFSLDTAIYESSKFDHANQTWNFSFGHNNADGYGNNNIE